MTIRSLNLYHRELFLVFAFVVGCGVCFAHVKRERYFYIPDSTWILRTPQEGHHQKITKRKRGICHTKFRSFILLMKYLCRYWILRLFRITTSETNTIRIMRQICRKKRCNLLPFKFMGNKHKKYFLISGEICAVTNFRSKWLA